MAKLGGSLWASPLLKGWLEALRQFPHRLTIVPGGGPFAGAVRQAQETMRFSDHAAHAMALLAMEQYAAALADLDKTLVLVATLEEEADAHDKGAAALWRPVAMAQHALDIPASWDVTSDSLAAWYAGETNATALLLVKSVDVAEGADIIASGLVDPLFSHYAEHIRVFAAGPSDLETAAGVFRTGGVPGATIRFFNSRREQKIAS